MRRVKDLASAILQIGQMVDAKFFKPPLGEGEKEKKKRLKEEEKRKKEREAANEEEGSATAGHSGMNFIKIGFPGKLIIRDYFQTNRTSRRPFL